MRVVLGDGIGQGRDDRALAGTSALPTYFPVAEQHVETQSVLVSFEVSKEMRQRQPYS